MSGWVVCPQRGDNKVALEVCLGVCEVKEDCVEFREVPNAELRIAKKKLGMPVEETPGAADGAVEIDGVTIEPAALPVERRRSSPEEANEFIARALFIRNDIEGKFYEMGEVLYVIFKKQYYVDAGYHDWRQFCDELLDIKWRTATYLKDIYQKFSEMEINDEERKGIGWAKLKELLPVVNAENVQHWLKVAKDRKLTVTQLNAMVKYAMGKITKEESEKVPQVIAFRLYEEQMKNVERALELARRLTGSDARSYQLEMICAEFRATYEAEEGTPVDRKKVVVDILRKMEAIMRVKFIGEVVDEGSGEIISETKPEEQEAKNETPVEE